MQKRDKLFVLCLIVGFSVIVYLINVFMEFRGKNNTKEIKENIQFADGYVNFVIEITEENGPPEQVQVEYDYKINGKTYTNSRNFTIEKSVRDRFLCKHFHVVYSSKHKDISDILTDKADSVKYGISDAGK